MFATEDSSLLCTEVLDPKDWSRTPEHKVSTTMMEADCGEILMPPTVRAMKDDGQLRDHRILQNLLRNEEKFMPCGPDYMNHIQMGSITPDMRKTVADWMLEVVREQYSQPEVFCLAVNVMDRFLSTCRIHKSQLQLLGSVCILIASKIREPCPIPGKTLITYTDYSITADELKDWELLVLYKLQWELTAITPLDYLDHTLPRLGLDEMWLSDKFRSQMSCEIPMDELRRRTETIIVLATTNYQFAYQNASLLAAASIFTAVQSLCCCSDRALREVKLRLQATTHSSTNHIDRCVEAINNILPGYLKSFFASESQPLPDSTSSPFKGHLISSTSSPTSAPMSTRSPEPDLICTEQLSNDSALADEDFEQDDDCCLLKAHPSGDSASPEALSDCSRSSSPLSAVDIFTEFNTNVLRPMYDQAENLDSPFSILVS